MNELEELRAIFKDDRLHNGLGTIVELGVNNAKTKLRVKVNLLPENREVIAEMGWKDVYDVGFPEIQDLVTVVFIDGHPDDCFVTSFISTKEEPLPKFSVEGDKVAYSRPKKKFYLGSDTKIGLGRPDVEPDEPIPLGQQLQDFLSNVLGQLKSLTDDVNSLAGATQSIAGDVNTLATAVSTHGHPPPGVAPPVNAPAMVAAGLAAVADGAQAALYGSQAQTVGTQLDSYKSSPVEDGSLNSQIAFTEKGAD